MSNEYELFLYDEKHRGGTAVSRKEYEDESLVVDLGATDFAGDERVRESKITLKDIDLQVRGVGDFDEEIRQFVKEESFDMVYDATLDAALQRFCKRPESFRLYLTFVKAMGAAEGYNLRSDEVGDAFDVLMGRTRRTYKDAEDFIPDEDEDEEKPEPSIENCHHCGAEFEIAGLLADCPYCGEKDVVACRSCLHWENQEPGECTDCVKGSNHSLKDED